ncbi:MAG: flagellar hook protein FlgE [Deltaproteobacteria bacterium]|nr:flagellar hook protein FlgE [Deltaproteobacteria bacterium]MBW2151763.1 flagellar hook protein FlgE [Deltaproteobacteria bacterium]
MSLTSSLFSGISGLSTLGNSLQIIGDNIANVNTLGFKASSFHFQDRLSQATATQAGTSQIGRGSALGDITMSFEQGSFETTGNTTDMAIGGEGFFVVREAGSQQLFYTRAGNFRYNKEGYLVNPEGYIVQGWVLDENGEDSGSVTDIQLSSFTSSPEASTKITIITNLDASQSSNTADLYSSWDGSQSTPLADTEYEYQTTVKVYDSLGSTHDITIYYDKGDTSNQWEYLITCNPDEDMRSGAIVSGSPKTGAGLLARGSLTFSSSSGTISDMSMALYAPSNWNSVATGWSVQSTASDLSSDGYFSFTPEFISGVSMTIKFNPGSHYDTSWANDALTTTQFSKASTTTYQASNGYGAGDLQSVDVDVDGLMTGVYSNGQLIHLNRVALAKFIDQQGLHKEGSGLFRETRESGAAITNHPGTNGLGSISPNSLEQSNVDIAAEFVKMITSQRGFQANSKIISTVDQMLSETIQMKR